MNIQYVVQTSDKIIERCILSASDPGDLVLDPTCGSGTTALRRRAAYYDDFPKIELTNLWSDTRGEMNIQYGAAVDNH